MPDLLDWLVENEPNFSKNRLPSLYSDLAQQKAANPGGFIKNASDWQAALTRAALAGRLNGNRKITLQTSDHILDALSSQRYGRPSGLGLILDEGIKTGSFMNLQDFSSSEQSVFQKSWIPSPYMILRWSLRQVGLLRYGSYDKDGRLQLGTLVLINGLEQVTKELIDARAEKGDGLADRVMSRQAFADVVAHLDMGKLSTSELEILLRFLQRDKGLLSYNSQTVKFRSTSAEHPEPITQEDSTIASIKSLITSLELQISALNTGISNLQTAAKTAVESKNKTSALSALRSKKLAEANLQSRLHMLHKLEDVYSKIEQAVDQAQMVQVMEASAVTLKSLNKRIGGIEKVDAIMDDLKEQMGQVDEIGQVLQEPLSGNATVDEAEVDEELETMEKEEAARKERQEAEATKSRLAELEQLPHTQEHTANEHRHVTTETPAGTVRAVHADRQLDGATEKSMNLDEELLSASQKLGKMQLDDSNKQIDKHGQPPEEEQPITA